MTGATFTAHMPLRVATGVFWITENMPEFFSAVLPAPSLPS